MTTTPYDLVLSAAQERGWYPFPARAHRVSGIANLMVRDALPGRFEVLLSKTHFYRTSCDEAGIALDSHEGIKEAIALLEPTDQIKGAALALAYISWYGGIDGSHHKQWTLDQAARALTDCPHVLIDTDHAASLSYPAWDQGESEAYKAWVAGASEVGPPLGIIRRFGVGKFESALKDWVMDQVARILIGDGYEDWVREQKAGEDGPDTYGWSTGRPGPPVEGEWDVGIPP